jgi:hypothetical protein
VRDQPSAVGTSPTRASAAWQLLATECREGSSTETRRRKCPRQDVVFSRRRAAIQSVVDHYWAWSSASNSFRSAKRLNMRRTAPPHSLTACFPENTVCLLRAKSCTVLSACSIRGVKAYRPAHHQLEKACGHARTFWERVLLCDGHWFGRRAQLPLQGYVGQRRDFV